MAGLGRKVFGRERATSADVNGYLMDQAVMVFASGSARDAAIPTGDRSPGMRVFLLDTFTEQFWDGAAWRRSAGRRNVGRVALGSGVNTDAGGNLVIPHGLNAIPTSITVTTAGQGSDLLDRIGDVRLSNYDSLNIVVRFIRTDQATVIANSPVAFDWSVER